MNENMSIADLNSSLLSTDEQSSVNQDAPAIQEKESVHVFLYSGKKDVTNFEELVYSNVELPGGDYC